jgi:hypothetical protein
MNSKTPGRDGIASPFEYAMAMEAADIIETMAICRELNIDIRWMDNPINNKIVS